MWYWCNQAIRSALKRQLLKCLKSVVSSRLPFMEAIVDMQVYYYYSTWLFLLTWGTCWSCRRSLQLSMRQWDSIPPPAASPRTWRWGQLQTDAWWTDWYAYYGAGCGTAWQRSESIVKFWLMNHYMMMNWFNCVLWWRFAKTVKFVLWTRQCLFGSLFGSRCFCYQKPYVIKATSQVSIIYQYGKRSNYCVLSDALQTISNKWNSWNINAVLFAKHIWNNWNILNDGNMTDFLLFEQHWNIWNNWNFYNNYVS